MEHVRYRDLDAYCEGIGDAREKLSEAKGEEQGYITGALASMKKKGVHVYKHAGIGLVLVPGDDKLQVRRLKGEEGEGADAPASGDTAPAADPDAGDALDDNTGDAGDEANG
jgi:hypothetical protein